MQAGLMDTYQRPLQKRGAVAWVLCAVVCRCPDVSAMGADGGDPRWAAAHGVPPDSRRRLGLPVRG